MAYALDHVINRRENFITSWKVIAPDAVLGGMTLEEFKEQTREPLKIRAEILKLQTHLKGRIGGRMHADKAAMVKMDLVINSVRGTPEYGSDCELYKAMGYIPTSERKTGLVRKQKKSRKTEDQ